MHRRHLRVDLAYPISVIDERLYGGFVEHQGRAVYTGIYEPAHPTANADGFRGDVIDLLKPLHIPLVRYPGGSFVSSHRWEDSVGPVGDRPKRLDLAWRSTESHEVGLAEFTRWADAIGADVMMAVNMGTRGLQEALELLEYCNHPGGSQLSDRRIEHGNREPFAIKTWCLGNEVDAIYQVGGKTADVYANLAVQTSRAMKIIDPTIETVACGTSTNTSASFPDWNRVVLEAAYEDIDYLSIHKYLSKMGGDTRSYMSRRAEFEDYIRTTAATIRHVKSLKRSNHDVFICFDEWNVWQAGESKLEFPRGYPAAPALLEDKYSVEDALIVGCMANALIRNSDVVKIACLAQLVNVIAPIVTEPGGAAWKQATFDIFAAVTQHGRGIALRVGEQATNASAPYEPTVGDLDCSAVFSPVEQSITLFIVNTSLDEATDLVVSLVDCGPVALREHTMMAGHPANARNSATAQPIGLVPGAGLSVEGGRLSGIIPAFSYHCVRLDVAPRPA